MAVLISIKPKYCELIASGKKTIEVRKTRPKCETPFKCYIYETKALSDIPQFVDEDGHVDYHGSGMVIGEFVCDFINKYTAEFVDDDDCYEEIRQIWENEEDEDFPYTAKITSNEDENPDNCFLCNASCLAFKEIKKYIGVNFHDTPFYGWHISDLKIYDKPKELGEFEKPCIDKYKYCQCCQHGIVQYPQWVETKEDIYGCCFETICLNTVKRPPQSWCYVYENN